MALSHLIFNLHIFRSWEIYPFGLKFLISKSGQQAEILALWYTFLSTTRKWHTGSHSTSQGQEKSFSQDANYEERCSRRKRVISQNISAPPGNPLISWYFGFWKWAMVKVLGLDDSKWKDVPYYSYDLVHNDNRK